MNNFIKNGQETGDRRKFPRKQVFTNVSYKILMPEAGAGETKDLSDGGLCIVVDKDLPRGTILELDFDVPGNEPVKIKASAEVIWQKKTDKGYITGLEFIII